MWIVPGARDPAVRKDDVFSVLLELTFRKGDGIKKERKL